MARASSLTGTSRRLLSGWGRANASAADVVDCRNADEIVAQLAGLGASGSNRGRPPHVLARGLGRSYGDAAQCAGGRLLDCTGASRILELDIDAGFVRAEAGASLDSMLRYLVPRGYFLPVSPGTRFVTLGGAIASDIHGKNHHVDGSIGAHVKHLRLATPGGVVECTQDENPEELAATCGGMGLTGVVSEATVDLVPIETSRMRVDTERAKDLDSCLDLLSQERGSYRYSVAWIDCLARGRQLGRSILTRGEHATYDELKPGLRRNPKAFDPRQFLSVPFSPPVSLLNPMTAAAFNEAWYRAAPRQRLGEIQPIGRFFHPLDGVAGWNLLYGPRGFTQYQYVVPFGAEAVIATTLQRLSAARVATFLAVLKEFGPEGAGYLSFPMQGWTLALDIPLGLPGLPQLLDGLDELVAEAGGRVYLSKDGRLRREIFQAMYPRLGEWLAVRKRLDPDGVLSSDLGRRLALVETP